MTPSNVAQPRVFRLRAGLIAFIFGCMILPVGCGEEAVQESTLPKDFAEKLEKEHPELFVRKVGKKTEKIEGRDKKVIIRQEYQKSLQQGAQ